MRPHPREVRIRPVVVGIEGLLPLSPEQVTDPVLDLDRWPEFTGHGWLPGIRRATFDHLSLDVVGTRIRVESTDGSVHVETITAWERGRLVELRFSGFRPPLAWLADHFVETWRVTPAPHGARVSRSIALHPRGWLGRLALPLVGRALRAAFLDQLRRGGGVER